MRVVAQLILALAMMVPVPTRACTDSSSIGEALRFSQDGSLTALLAPEGWLLEYSPRGHEVSRRRRLPWVSETPIAILTGAGALAVLPIRSSEPDAPCYIPEWRFFSGPLASPRPRPLRWVPGGREPIGPLHASPSGRYALVVAGLYTDADAAARVFVFDLRRRRIETELPGSDAIWLSDDLIVAVDHSATRVLLHRRTHGGWVSRPSYQPEREGVALLLVEESAGRVVMFERGPPNRLLVAHHQGDMVGWVPQPTQLERTPQLISLAGDVAVRLGRDDVTVRGLADAEPFARMVGARSYTSMTLSPDGRRLALVEHAQAADPDDVLLEPRARGSMQGEPTLHVIDLRRREHFVWGRSPATEVTFEVADTEQANR